MYLRAKWAAATCRYTFKRDRRRRRKRSRSHSHTQTPTSFNSIRSFSEFGEHATVCLKRGKTEWNSDTHFPVTSTLDMLTDQQPLISYIITCYAHFELSSKSNSELFVDKRRKVHQNARCHLWNCHLPFKSITNIYIAISSPDEIYCWVISRLVGTKSVFSVSLPLHLSERRMWIFSKFITKTCYTKEN